MHDSQNNKYKNLVNFEFAEKFMYGRVNRDYVPVYLNTQVIKLERLPTSPSPYASFYACSFVAEAFKDLSLQFVKSAAKGAIRADDDYLSELVVHKAYETPIKLFSKHSTIYKESLKKHFKAKKIKFETFEQFVIELKKSLIKTARRSPFTFPAYIKSRYCPITCSGLAIEIANLKYENDEEKIEKFINSKNWEFYLNACRTYGFSVDQTYPWRLVADIGSEPMMKYAARHGMYTTSEILKTGFKKAPIEYYSGFKQTLMDYYNFLKPRSFIEVEYCQFGPPIQTVKSPIVYKTKNLSKKLPEAYFLDLYFTIRFLEEESLYSESKMKLIKRQCAAIYRKKGAPRAIDVFEKLLNQTYDYSGSLTSRVKSAKLIEQERVATIDEESTSDTSTVSGY